MIWEDLKSPPETGDPMTDGKTAFLAAYFGATYIDGEFAPEFWSQFDNEDPRTTNLAKRWQRPQHVVGCISSVDECVSGLVTAISVPGAMPIAPCSWRLDALPDSARLVYTSKWTKILRLQSCNTACQLASSSATSFPIPLPTSASGTSYSSILIVFRISSSAPNERNVYAISLHVILPHVFFVYACTLLFGLYSLYVI